MRRGSEPAAAGVDHDNAVLVGRLLRNHRERRGLGSADVAQAIKVGERHVLAVEQGRFVDLPPQPYGRGLIRSYAVLLGLDPEELLRACGPALNEEGGGALTGIFPRSGQGGFRWREWAVPLTLAAAVVAIGVARTVFAPPPVEQAAAVNASAPAARPIEQLAARAAVSAAPDTPVEAPLAAPGVRVTLRSEGTTWAEATPDGGEARRYELGPGQNLALEARDTLRLALGDAGVIRLRVNDRELGFIGFKGEPKSGLTFTAPKAPAAPAAPAAVKPVAGD
jgi:hypothetical protein